MSGRIVVGVDGSPSSKAALAWAVEQARLTDASVEAVIAWHYPVAVGGIPFAPLGAADFTDYGELAMKVLSDAIAATMAPDDAVKICLVVRAGNAAQVLMEAAEGAELLVVGSRGHGGFSGVLLGSVSQACVHHACCPVVIIRAAGSG